MYQFPCRDCTNADVQDLDDVMTLTQFEGIQPNPVQRYACPICGYAWTNSRTWQRGDKTLHYVGLVLMLIVAFAGYYLLHLGVVKTGVGVGVTAILIGVTEQLRSWLEDILDPVDDAQGA